MKKIALTLALAIIAFAANAQIVISANIGGSMNSGSKLIQTDITGGQPYSGSQVINFPQETTLSAGIKFGYKFGKFQVGLAGGYEQISGTNLPLDPTIVPIMQNSIPTILTTGYMNQKNSAITVAPYFRYDIIQAGDVSLFAELNVLYSKTLTPMCWAEIHDSNIAPGTYFVHDTSGTFPHPINTTTLGASIVPGLSWQLSSHCGIDLYFDFLAIAYTKATTTRTDINHIFDFVGTLPMHSYTETNSCDFIEPFSILPITILPTYSL